MNHRHFFFPLVLSTIPIAAWACSPANTQGEPSTKAAIPGGNRGPGGPSTPSDASVEVTDAPPLVHTTTVALHDIDVGKVEAGKSVTVTGIIVTGLAFGDGFEPDGSNLRRYRAFAQDPMGMAPCGIQLTALGPACTPNANMGCDCPAPADSNTSLAQLAIGDQIDVSGHVHLVAVAGDGGPSYAEHELEPLSVTKSGTGDITPTVVTDPTPFAKNGTGYRDLESMLVTLQPMAGITVTGPSASFLTFSGGGAFFAGTYGAAFENGGMFPPAKSQWASITGVANPVAGGGVAPRTDKDFVQ